MQNTTPLDASINVAIIGVTGAVGQTMLKILQQRNFTVKNLFAVASHRSAGKTISFNGKKIVVQDIAEFDFSNTDIALFSAGSSVSIKYAPIAASKGAVVIDNTSAFRMNENVPLVIPEVNKHHAANRPLGIIANPNCSTIQMLVAIAPLHKKSPIKRIIVSTYQSVSGAGTRAIDELKRTSAKVLDGKTPTPGPIFDHVIGFNCIPQIDVFNEDGYTKEEHKMMNETRKILNDDNILVSATCVRVPVMLGHAESINIETQTSISKKEAINLISNAPGCKIIENSKSINFPMQIDCAGKDETFIGRVRKDPSHPNALDIWVCADNLRKGAATNAVQIAEIILNEKNKTA